MRITRIESQKRRPGRKNIYVDGTFLTGASEEAVAHLGLRSGDTVTPEVLERLQRTDSYLAARRTSLRLLAVRPRSVQELRVRLRKRGLPETDIDKVIADLAQASLLDDRAVARAIIQDCLTLKPSGPSLMRRKLISLGIPSPIVEESLARELGTVDQDRVATEAAEAYLRKHPGGRRRGPDDALRRRTAAHLARRGFTWETIRSVLKRVLSDDSGGDDE